MKLPNLVGERDVAIYENGSLTNNENLQHHINEHEIDYKPRDGYKKVLGINWNYKNEIFIFDFSQIMLEANKLGQTKRNMFKITGKFFDSL